ncbi:hypothetical protein [Candidatus Igneacidithiobacillus taiwanensis]|uniref:hypothetical protein n=1 Tax=Candidatus Igneacidithiobacillus taiwanensis TaxID=1945924 RepID=UPI0028A02869|nr:hypothetical protein [Candidatus Igneacidithiobacillus taiwanensis]
MAIRLIRWSEAIELTPRQKHVMDQVVTQAIQRSSKVILAKIRAATWSIPDHRADHADLAYSAATKALQHLVESHDFCGANPIPNPSLLAFVESHTRFASRESLEFFIYHKKWKKEETTTSSPAGFLLETYIRQQKSLLRNKSGAEKAKAEQKIAELTARLYGLRAELRLDALEPLDGTDSRLGRLSPATEMELAYWDTYAEDETKIPVPIPSHQREFLDYLFQVGDKAIPARELIPYLIDAREFRAIGGLLRVLRDPDREEEADTLSTVLGNRTLADIRKQILRIRQSDSEEMVQLFGICKDFLQSKGSESELMQNALICGA